MDMIAISATATRFIHLYFLPSVHEPGSNESPIRHRRKIGTAKARYRPITAIETTARKATGAPFTLTRAGAVITAPTMADSSTALTGTLEPGLTFDQRREPGMAPSRLKAKVIREQLVMHAAVQKS